jgi:hypothetical protein
MNLSFVLIDETTSAATLKLTPAVLADIAEACQTQLNADYGPECGGEYSVRVGKDSNDILPGEVAYIYQDTLPQAPTAEAYHDVQGNGVPFALCALDDCQSLTGEGSSASSATSHELLETAGNPGCNKFLNDGQGNVKAAERCDAVEVQTYPITVTSGNIVYVSNFVLDSWQIPGSAGPYTFMTKAGLEGGVDPSGPMQTAPGGGGNYQIVAPFTDKETQITAKFAAERKTDGGVIAAMIQGKPKNLHKTLHWSSRARRIARARV